MIRKITAGPGIHIANNSFSTPHVFMNTPSAGMVRYNGSSFEVYDGNIWLTLGSSCPQIELTSEVQYIIDWARKKMAEEARIKELASQHPTVAGALKAVEQAEEQVRVVAALVDNT
jgi:hypothetical protein